MSKPRSCMLALQVHMLFSHVKSRVCVVASSKQSSGLPIPALGMFHQLTWRGRGEQLLTEMTNRVCQCPSMGYLLHLVPGQGQQPKGPPVDVCSLSTRSSNQRASRLSPCPLQCGGRRWWETHAAFQLCGQRPGSKPGVWLLCILCSFFECKVSRYK